MQIFFKPLALDLLSVLGDGTIIEELVGFGRTHLPLALREIRRMD
jgi:hypothetical protein